MSHCLSSKRCYHIGSMETIHLPIQGWTAVCTKCGTRGSGGGTSIAKAIDYFWKKSTDKWDKEDTEKETKMSSDYRRGVEDALKLDIMFVGSYTAEYLLEKIDEKRKNLLTKKVTKWVNVYSDGTEVKVAPSTFDTEQAAKEGAIPGGVLTELFGSYIGTYQKTIPFEIEVPID